MEWLAKPQTWLFFIIGFFVFIGICVVAFKRFVDWCKPSFIDADLLRLLQADMVQLKKDVEEIKARVLLIEKKVSLVCSDIAWIQGKINKEHT